LPKKSKKGKKLKHEPYWDFKAFLTREGIKLREVASLFGHTVQTISMKNNGSSDYTMKEIDVICNHFKISSEIFRSRKVS
jgi:hypothetical protein